MFGADGFRGASDDRPACRRQIGRPLHLGQQSCLNLLGTAGLFTYRCLVLKARVRDIHVVTHGFGSAGEHRHLAGSNPANRTVIGALGDSGHVAQHTVERTGQQSTRQPDREADNAKQKERADALGDVRDQLRGLHSIQLFVDQVCGTGLQRREFRPQDVEMILAGLCHRVELRGRDRPQAPGRDLGFGRIGGPGCRSGNRVGQLLISFSVTGQGFSQVANQAFSIGSALVVGIEK